MLIMSEEDDYDDGPALTALQFKALSWAISVAPDFWCVDAGCLYRDENGNEYIDHLAVGDDLPSKHKHRYDKPFYEKMAVASKVFGKRLLPYAERALTTSELDPIPLTTAEELILDALVREAQRQIDDETWHYEEVHEWGETREKNDDVWPEPTHADRDWGMFTSVALWDRDFEMLFDDASDGIERDDHPIAQQLGFANLEFKDWFEPFGGLKP
jgi:hypothetical protein